MLAFRHVTKRKQPGSTTHRRALPPVARLGLPNVGQVPTDPPAPHPLVRAAHRVADEVLRPSAELVDGLALLPRSHLDALADAGLMGIVGPVDHGGSAVPDGVARLIQRVIAGACGATFFTWAQHHSPVRYLSTAPDSPARRRWLAPLCAGSARAGVAFAYLRRPGPPAVRAERDGGGWVLDGVAPFVTGWGLVDVIVVVAGAPDGRKVFAAVPVDQSGLGATPLDLMVLGATGTVSLALDGVRIGPDSLVDVWPGPRWDAADREAAARPTGAPFGIADAAIDGLAASDPEVSRVLAAQLDACAGRVEELLAAGALGAHDLDALVVERDRSIDLANRAAQAWVAAAGGRAMARSHPAQRVLREAAFYLVQAQTPELRALEMARLAAVSRR